MVAPLPDSEAQKNVKRYDIAKLSQLYTDSDSCDKDIFSEMRSNVLLAAGDHYTKRGSRWFERVRSSREVSAETKVRLTKNHIGRITKTYANNILTYAPGIFCNPKNETELQDQKSANLHESVWKDIKEKNDFEDWLDNWADDFVEIGEVATKVWWDEIKGAVVGHQPLVSELGEQIIDPMSGAQAMDMSAPIFAGQLSYEEVHGFNLLRDSGAKTMKESPFLAVRKMVKTDRLKKAFPAVASKISESQDQTFMVFDTANGSYRKQQADESFVVEMYWRPDSENRNGWYQIFIPTAVILQEGELPGGIFPLVVRTFERIKTTPRGRSIIKQLRPYQIEINRCGSKMAEHQMTLGDDKLVTFNGSKVSSGVALPGVRHISVNSGGAPTVIAGRSGAQYLEPLNSSISEMYQVAMVVEDGEENTNGQLDAYAMLFKSAKQKKKFQRYIRRFESFLKEVCKTSLQMAKCYMSDEQVIQAIGKSERVNISEFKKHDGMGFEVILEPMSEDIETMMGKQLVMNHLIQYMGSQMSREDLGQVVRNMPLVNSEQLLSDLTLNYDNAVNDILALDRGETPPVLLEDDHMYMVNKLTNRMRKADFRFLHPFIQNNYQKTRQAHADQAEQVRQKLAQDNAGLVPTTGALVDAGIWTEDPNDPTKTKRVRLPNDALQWLLDKLQNQGTQLQSLTSSPEATQAVLPGPSSQMPPQSPMPQ